MTNESETAINCQLCGHPDCPECNPPRPLTRKERGMEIHARCLETALKKVKEENSELRKKVANQTEHIKGMKILEDKNRVLKGRIDFLLKHPEWFTFKMCGKKKSYPTKGKAALTAEHFKGRVYNCPVCSCWHVTSKDADDE